jgi:hypothetical protein
MAELSLLQGDVQLDVSGDLKLLTEAERRANPQDVARDDRVRTALLRFVEHSIVRPDASQRPFWMSDPHYMLAGQYRGFSFSFYERILKRVATELSEHGNAAPLVSLLWFVPVMMMSDALRDLIQHGTDGPPWKRGWSVWDHVQNSAVRAGFLGHYENLTKAVEYPSSVLGPTGAQLVDWSQSIPNASKDVLNAMPLSVLYKNWFKRGKQYGELDQGGHQEAWSAPQGAWGSGW